MDINTPENPNEIVIAELESTLNDVGFDNLVLGETEHGIYCISKTQTLEGNEMRTVFHIDFRPTEFPYFEKISWKFDDSGNPIFPLPKMTFAPDVKMIYPQLQIAIVQQYRTLLEKVVLLNEIVNFRFPEAHSVQQLLREDKQGRSVAGLCKVSKRNSVGESLEAPVQTMEVLLQIEGMVSVEIKALLIQTTPQGNHEKEIWQIGDILFECFKDERISAISNGYLLSGSVFYQQKKAFVRPKEGLLNLKLPVRDLYLQQVESSGGFSRRPFSRRW